MIYNMRFSMRFDLAGKEVRRVKELVACAGSAEGVSAAVQSGADAVLIGFSIGEERGANELTEDELGRAAQFCRVRGVKTYVELDGSPSDDQLPQVLEKARRAARMGADALVAEDLGLLWALRRVLPSMPVHAGPGLGIHDADGLRMCASMGIRRVALPVELSADRLMSLAEDSPVELEIYVQGPLCVSFAGSCMLPALAGEPCRRQCVSGFKAGLRDRHPLSMKDLSLIGETEFLNILPAAALRVGSRDRRPEYCAAVTGVWARVLSAGRGPTADDRALLEAVASGGSTDGYLRGGEFSAMLGAASGKPEEDSALYANLRRNYLNREFQRVPVTFEVELSLEKPFSLTGAAPELAFHTETTPAMLRTELFNTAGTPFRCEGVTAVIDRGVWLNPREVGPVRDRLLQELLLRRVAFEPRSEGDLPELPEPAVPAEPPVLTVSVLRCAQLSQRLLSLAPPVVYLPLEEAVSGDRRLEPFLDSPHISVCAVLPPVIFDSELGGVTEMLLKARQLGIQEVSVSNLGHVAFVRKMGFEVRGDPALAVRNSCTLAVLSGLRLRSACLRGDLTASQVRGLKKNVDTELSVYGRMPLIYSAGCVIRARTGACSCDSFTGLPDASGFMSPVTRCFGCRNTVWSSRKLHLAPRSREYLTAGLWGVRLNFTTENAEECARVAERYLELGSYEPASTTQGRF